MKALVFGGSGLVGGEVLRALHRASLSAVFTYRRSADKAQALAKELGFEAAQVDLADAAAVRALVTRVCRDGTPDVFIHCAAVSGPRATADTEDAEWAEVHAVNVQSAFIATQVLAPHMAQKKRGSIVFVGALDRTQALPLPAPFAATQGALSAMTMALAKELGRDGILVNQVALGMLDGGMSAQLGAKLVEDYKLFSALRRPGTAAEAAKVIVWLALENTYVCGKVLAVNGGI